MVELRDDYTDLEGGSQRKSSKLYAVAAAIVIGLVAAVFLLAHLANPAIDTTGVCPQFDKVAPHKDNAASLKHILHAEDFKKASMGKLGGAIKIPTEIGDDFTSPKESLDEWTQFEVFHKYLEHTFPTVYEALKVETVNTYGLLYTWKGTDKDLKPMLFAAHQDVVPVNNKTLDQWEHSPFSGHFDGEYIWGRGASDCKNLLIGLLETVEFMLAENFKPKRTILLSFGFDEEASGRYGAFELGQLIHKRYGDNGIYALIDEGPGEMAPMYGLNVISPATGEKGYVNVITELSSPGGHSSVPPKHTSIGYAAEYIALCENNSWDSVLTSKNPTLNFFQCLAAHSTELPDQVKRNYLAADKNVKANDKLRAQLSQNPITDVLQRTSLAFDIINGGVKSNALPETVVTVANSRIAVESSVDETLDFYIQHAITVAEKYDLGVFADGKEILPKTANGFFNIIRDKELEPAPVSPLDNEVWATLVGSIRHFYEDVLGNENVVVAPSLMFANTDTKHYWKSTENIYRYTPNVLDPSTMKTIHSVNEHVSAASHLQVIAFMYEFIHTIA